MEILKYFLYHRRCGDSLNRCIRLKWSVTDLIVYAPTPVGEGRVETPNIDKINEIIGATGLKYVINDKEKYLELTCKEDNSKPKSLAKPSAMRPNKVLRDANFIKEIITPVQNRTYRIYQAKNKALYYLESVNATNNLMSVSTNKVNAIEAYLTAKKTSTIVDISIELKTQGIHESSARTACYVLCAQDKVKLVSLDGKMGVTWNTSIPSFFSKP